MMHLYHSILKSKCSANTFLILAQSKNYSVTTSTHSCEQSQISLQLFNLIEQNSAASNME